MAHCVISGVVDTGCGGELRQACVVHTAFAPCRHDGEPACPAPLHAWGSDRADVTGVWEARTHRQRPLIIHDLSRIPDPADHVVEDSVQPCPCGAEVLPAGGDS